MDNNASKSIVGKLIEMFTSQFDGEQRSEVLFKLLGAELLINEVSGATASGGSGRGGVLEIGSILKVAGLDLNQTGPLIKW